MTVTNCNHIGTTLTSFDATGERGYISRYRVITNDVNDGPITVGTTTVGDGIPAINDNLAIGNDFDNGVYANSYASDYEDLGKSRMVWIVTVNYTSTPSRRNQGQEDDPVNQSPIISGGGVRFSTIAEFDKDNQPIVNSVNDIITGVEKDDDRSSLRIQKNFDTIDLDQFAEFASTVNDATFFGLTSRKWKMSHPRWEQRFRGNDVPFYTVTFEFEAKSETWDVHLYDRGHFHLDGQGNKQRFKDGSGIIQSTPQNLDQGGFELAAGNDPVPAPGSPFQLYETKDFSLLGIPTSL